LASLPFDIKARGVKTYLGTSSPEQQRDSGKIANPEGWQKGAKTNEFCFHQNNEGYISDFCQTTGQCNVQKSFLPPFAVQDLG